MLKVAYASEPEKSKKGFLNGWIDHVVDVEFGENKKTATAVVKYKHLALDMETNVEIYLVKEEIILFQKKLLYL